MTDLNGLHYHRNEWCVNRSTLEFIIFRLSMFVIDDIASRFLAYRDVTDEVEKC